MGSGRSALAVNSWRSYRAEEAGDSPEAIVSLALERLEAGEFLLGDGQEYAQAHYDAGLALNFYGDKPPSAWHYVTSSADISVCPFLIESERYESERYRYDVLLHRGRVYAAGDGGLCTFCAHQLECALTGRENPQGFKPCS